MISHLHEDKTAGSVLLGGNCIMACLQESVCAALKSACTRNANNMLLRCRLTQISDICADNIWNDQSLELDSDLPSGWRTIRDSTGTYYWHVPTGTTQWQHPSYSAEEEQNSINGITASQIKVRYTDLCMCFCVCCYVALCMFLSAVTFLYS